MDKEPEGYKECVSKMLSTVKNLAEKQQLLDYLCPFAYQKEFTSGKRFARYVEKASEYIFETYVRQCYKSLFEPDVRPLYSLEDVVLFYFEEYYNHRKIIQGGGRGRGNTMLEGMRPLAAYTDEMEDENIEWKMNMLQNPHESIDGFPSMSEIFQAELKETCIQMIREKGMWRENINQTNYFAALPENVAESALMMEGILNAIHADIEIITKSAKARASAESPGIMDELTSLRKQVGKLGSQLEEKGKIIEGKNAEIMRLKKRIAESPAGNGELADAIDDLSEKCQTLERMNLKLVERYNAMAAKYNRACGQAESQKGCEEKKEEGFKEVDPYGKYVFFATENTFFRENLLKQFPNSLFFDDIVNLKQMKVDMVVVITSHIKHPVYYKIRSQCKNMGIPFIQCKHSNSETIKGLMWEYVNFKKASGYKHALPPGS